MAVDTLKIRSPYLTEEQAIMIEYQLVLHEKYRRSTGEIFSTFTRDSLAATWDARISVAVRREEWHAERLRIHQRTHTTLRECAPYVEVECSVHKAIVGHNIAGGPQDVQSAAAWLVDYLGSQFGVDLPEALTWEVRRVDWCECFGLSFDGVQEYMHGLNQCTFPRRTISRYGTSGVYCPGSTTTVKLYHKGPEFQKHDKKRLSPLLEKSDLVQLQHEANEVLRVEVEVKARKLDVDFGHTPTVAEVTEAYLTSVYDREITRLLREGKATMVTVRTHTQVRDRLFDYYGARPALAGRLFGTWLQLAALGEKATRKTMASRTFYRQRAQLEEAGVSWNGADVRIVPTATVVPVDFKPVRDDSRRIVLEHPVVVQQLASYRMAA